VLGPYNLIALGTGTLATFATGLAVYHRLRTGVGQQAQASLAQTATYQQTPYMLKYKGHERREPRGYTALGTGPLNRFYRASNGWFFLAVPREDAAKLSSVEGLGNVDESEESLEKAFAAEDAATWVARLRKAGLSAQAWVRVAELMEDPYVRKRGLSVTQEVEGVGTTTAPGVTVRLSRTPMRVGQAPRRPGSDAGAILDELGLAEALPRLEKQWVLQVNDLPGAW
jgi:formyl-CoA transferase